MFSIVLRIVGWCARLFVFFVGCGSGGWAMRRAGAAATTISEPSVGFPGVLCAMSLPSCVVRPHESPSTDSLPELTNFSRHPSFPVETSVHAQPEACKALMRQTVSSIVRSATSEQPVLWSYSSDSTPVLTTEVYKFGIGDVKRVRKNRRPNDSTGSRRAAYSSAKLWRPRMPFGGSFVRHLQDCAPSASLPLQYSSVAWPAENNIF